MSMESHSLLVLFIYDHSYAKRISFGSIGSWTEDLTLGSKVLCHLSQSQPFSCWLYWDRVLLYVQQAQIAVLVYVLPHAGCPAQAAMHSHRSRCGLVSFLPRLASTSWTAMIRGLSYHAQPKKFFKWWFRIIKFSFSVLY
jgi:hypothetical protein